MAHTPASSSRISRRRFLAGTGAAVGAATFGRAPAVIGQQVRELQVWHTEVEPQTVKVIQDTSIAEFEKKFPGFKVRQQALGGATSTPSCWPRSPRAARPT
jgi:ABC-type glycerol-3-phosphate transport system substrate-binding protein